MSKFGQVKNNDMSVAEMKLEVIKKITNVSSEVVLQEVLALLKDDTEREKSAINLSNNYDAIKDQYGDVLQKLAQ